MCSYQSHSELLRRMRRLVQRFPHLVQMGELTPRSVEGRPLAYLKISEGVERRHLGEPMFKYVGNMHGDETLGRQLLIYLAEYLLQNYGHDPQVRTKLHKIRPRRVCIKAFPGANAGHEVGQHDRDLSHAHHEPRWLLAFQGGLRLHRNLCPLFPRRLRSRKRSRKGPQPRLPQTATDEARPEPAVPGARQTAGDHVRACGPALARNLLLL